MINIFIGDPFGLNTNELSTAFTVCKTIKTSTLSEFEITSGDVTVEFDGGNLQYATPDGLPSAGDIHTLRLRVDGKTVMDIAFSRDADDIASAIRGLQNGGNNLPFLNLFAGEPQTYTGSNGNDTVQCLDFFQNTTADICNSAGGNDICDLGRGNDTFNCGAGNDICQQFEGDGDDVCNGGDGIDTLFHFDNFGATGCDVDLSLPPGRRALAGPNPFGNNTYIGIENVLGTGNADSIKGSAIANRFEGKDGADTLEGGGGNDTLLGEAGADRLSGGGGKDTLNGGADNDALIGDAGNDVLGGGDGTDLFFGSSGVDRMFGATGNDSFNSGAGKHAIVSGAGVDIIAFTAASWGGDSVSDFQDGSDLLRFKRAIADNISDFAITGNGTASVTLAIGAQTLALKGAAPITLTAADFQFLA